MNNIHTSDNLEYIIEKLEDTYFEISGKSLRKRHLLDSDEFLKQANFINNKIVEYRKAQKLRDELVDAKDSQSTVSRIKATQKLKDMLKEIKNQLDSLNQTLNRQKKFKGEQKLRKTNIASKKDTYKHLQKIVKNLQESEYLVQDMSNSARNSGKIYGKHLRFGKF